jgi:tetratricopeptide (TPR) repeat protein
MRLIPSDTSVPTITPPLRVLLLISSPPSLKEDSRVDVESERAAVEQATREMREAGLLHLLVEDIVTPKRVQQVLMRFKPHIVHYIGHGGYYEKTGGVLLWEDERGDVLSISDVRLADILRPRDVYAVILHACETGKSNARTDVRGVAGTLVKEGIPAVLAQQANITYESSQRASGAWYTALTAGQGLADSLFEVRQALSQADRPDWVVPILQGNVASLAPILDTSAAPGPPDPLLSSQGAAADLPTPTGVFVGRHRELRALRLMLENAPGSGPVLALITGPGGVGKSTLAAQAVTRYGGKYKATLTLSCLGYQSVDLFLQRIGEFLKRHEAPGFLEQTLPDPKLSTTAKIEEAIAIINQTGPFLLIIDNLESVQEDQTLRDESLLQLLQKLLTNLRGGRVLITGRYAVKDLLPNGKFAAHLLRLDLDDLSSYETNQLLTRHPTLAHLGETVRQTLIDEFGGLPYVYDLLSSDAASQSLDLLIHDVQGRITEERKQRTAQEWQEVRQQVVEFVALEATVNRLSEPSRTLLARLGVLLRPFPLAAIGQGLGAARGEWQPLLDWSLLRYDPLEGSYRLHSITRHYVEDQPEGLLNEQDCKQTQAKLAAWYERYATGESHNLADYLEAHRLWRASGNVRRAGELVMQIAEPLRRFGLYPLLHELCTTTLHDIGEKEELLVAIILHELGNIAQLQRDYLEAERLYQQSLAIAKHLDNQRSQADTLGQLGNITQQQGDYKRAHQLYQESLRIADHLGNQSQRAVALHGLGIIARLQGDYQEARQFYQQSLEIEEQLDNQSGRAGSLHELGNIARLQGDYQGARPFYQQSLEIHKRQGSQRGQADILNQLGVISQEQGEYEDAWHFYQQSLDIYERMDDQGGRTTVLHNLGIIARLQGNYQDAQRFYQQSLVIAELLGDQSRQADILAELGNLALIQGSYRDAQRLYQQSLKISEWLGNQRGQAGILHSLGIIARLQKDYEQAQQFSQRSLQIFERLGDQQGRATALGQLGNIAQEQESYEQAQQLYLQSLEIKEQLGDQHGQATVAHNLGMLARQQGDLEKALTYLVQAYVLFDSLRSPSRDTAQREIAKIRSQIGEATFAEYWRALAGDLPLPDFSLEDTDQQMPKFSTESVVDQQIMQTLVDFIQAPTWEDSKRFLESHPELLQPEIDTGLQQWAMQQENDSARESIEEYRSLLARCRDMGIEATFAELQGAKSSEATFAAALNHICSEVVVTLRSGDAGRQKVLATQLERMLREDLPIEGAQDFLQVLVIWLHGQDTRIIAEEKLQPVFRDAYAQMVSAVEREETENADEEEDTLKVEDLPGVVSSVILRGTAEQRQQITEELMKAEQQVMLIEPALGRFFGCLAATLQGQTPEAALLEAPFTDLWQEFQDALATSSGEEDQQLEEKHD